MRLLLTSIAWLAAALPTSTPLPVRTVTLTPVDFQSSYTQTCQGAAQPPFAHPPSTVFVGAVTRSAVVCSLYQGLVHFDLDGLDASSIQSARLFYEGKQGYNLDGTTNRDHETCIGSVGTVGQAWNAEDKPLTPTLAQRDYMRAPKYNFKKPPIDVTAYLRLHLDDVKANGLAFDGAVEGGAAHHCLAAIGNIELRLGISSAP